MAAHEREALKERFESAPTTMCYTVGTEGLISPIVGCRLMSGVEQGLTPWGPTYE